MPTPLDIPGHHEFHGDGPFFPFLGVSMFLLLLVALTIAALYLHRTGRLPALGRFTRPAPEEEAKRILADRFARGDLSSEEFMERASILNWTPGSEQWPAQTRKRVRR
jgi:putative membrane protein